MVRVSLYDDLELEPAAGEQGSDFMIEWAADAPQPSTIDWPVRDDLTVRAHRLLEDQTGRALPVRGRLRKRIPVGAGLAGGSSDGATMLRALNEMFELGLGGPQLARLATELGSDLAFFLGPASAIVAGLGDRIEPAPLRRPIDLVLILPDMQCNTGAVYRQFDASLAEDRGSGPTADVDNAAVRHAAEAPDVSDMLLFNDLAEPAMRVRPDLQDLRSRCEEAIGRPVHVTGSGAGLFALAENASEALRLAEQLRREARVAAEPVSSE